MDLLKKSVAALLLLAAPLTVGVRSVPAETSSNLLRETLRLQSFAARSSCSGVQRTISAGTDPTLVVRTAVEIGYNSCEVIRCALDPKSAPPELLQQTLCELVIRGAVAAAVQPDVISRCSTDFCDPAAVAAILSETLLEPNYCYFTGRALVAPDLPPPPEPVFERSLPQPQASPFTF
jgi:hypothetical protein